MLIDFAHQRSTRYDGRNKPLCKESIIYIYNYNMYLLYYYYILFTITICLPVLPIRPLRNKYYK